MFLRIRTRRLAAAIAAIVAVGLLGPPRGFAFEIKSQSHVLPNGLRIVLAPDPTVPTVSYHTIMDVGSRDETKPGTTGLAHVFEHMMFRGTKRFPNFDAVVKPWGAQTNASTGNDLTDYFVNAKSEFLKDIIDLEADRVRNLSFANEIFRTELGPVKEERRRGVDEDPYGFMETRLYDLAFEKHTYKHPVIGWEEDLEKLMTYDDAIRFKETFYEPKHVVISVAGNFNPDSALAWIKQKYGDWAPGKIKPDPIPVEPPQQAPKSETRIWKDAMIAPIIMLAYKAPAMRFDTPDYVTNGVIDRLLFSNSGRLHKRLVVDQQLVEEVSGGVSGGKDLGLWTITATVKGGVTVDSVATIIIDELRKLGTTTVPSEELSKAINSLKADRVFGFDRPARIASTLGRYAVISGSAGNVQKEMELLSTVTPQMVMDFAHRYLIDAGRTMLIMTPKPKS
jgi:zinc protease